MPIRPPRGTALLSEIFQADPNEAWRILREEGLNRQRSRFRRNPDVWAVEIGLREVGGLLQMPPEPCLKIYVFRKGSPSQGFEVDPWTTVMTPTYGRVAFRTDVEPLGIAHAQAVNRISAAQVKRGSGFYVVETAQARFFLSAGHVLEENPVPGDVVQWQRGTLSGSGRLLRGPNTFWPLWRDDQARVAPADLALAEIGPADQLGPFGVPGEVPEAAGFLAWSDTPAVDVQVCGSNGVRSAQFSGRVEVGYPVQVRSNTVSYWRLFRYRLTGSATVGGDSGSPIIDNATGKLVGMHVALLEADQPLRRYSLSICAGDIVERLSQALGPVRLRIVGP